MIKTAIITAYIVHKVWWKMQHRTRTVRKGSKDWERVVNGS